MSADEERAVTAGCTTDPALLLLIEPELRTGEVVAMTARALLPVPRPFVGSTFASVHGLVGIFSLLTFRSRLDKCMQRPATFGMPVSRRMQLVVTNERIIVVEASRRRRARFIVGSIDRSALERASMPFVGNPKFKIFDLVLVSRGIVRLRVAGDQVEALRASLA